jgi:hypothetical protein
VTVARAGGGGGSESDVAVDAGQPEPTVTVLRGRVTVGLRRLPSQVRPGPEAPGFKSPSRLSTHHTLTELLFKFLKFRVPSN